MKSMYRLLPLFLLCPEGDGTGGGGGAPAGPAPGSLLGGGAGPGAPAAPAAPAAPDAPAAPAAYRDQLLGPDGKFNPNFVDLLPDDLKGHAATLSRFPDITELARSYVNARGKLSERPAPPPENATPEQVNAWRELVGVPETPDGYGIKPPESLPAGVEWDAAMAKGFAELAHKHHVPPGAVKDMLEWYTSQQGDLVKAAQDRENAWYQEHIAKQEQELRATWGDKVDTNFAAALKAARTFGLPSDKPSEWTAKDVVLALHRAATMISEDKFVTTGDGGGKHPKAVALEIMDPGNQDRNARAYRGEFGPGEQAAAQKYLEGLLAQAAQATGPAI